MPRYTFGPFSLDPEARVLLRDGEPMPMAGKTLDVHHCRSTFTRRPLPCSHWCHQSQHCLDGGRLL